MKATPLKGFIGRSQAMALASCLIGEEGEYFEELITKLGERISAMPKTYDQQGLGKQAIAYLHYFMGGCDWWITEKDAGAEGDSPEQFQSQAYGMASLGYDAEMGYISIPEILAAGAELDLHWEPKTLAECRKERGA